MKRKITALLVFALFIISVSAVGFKGEMIAKDRKVTIDFRDAELLDVIRIISRNFDLNIIAGDEIKGKVTVSLSDVPVDDALEMILKMNNYVYVKDGAIVRVVSQEKAQKEYGGTKEVKSSSENKKVYKVFEIKNATAQSVSDKIKGVIKSDDRIIVDENSNKIVAFVEQGEISIIETIIKEVDVEGKAGLKIDKNRTGEVEIVPVKYTSASGIETIIKDVYPDINARIKVNEKAGIIINGTPEEIEKIKKLIKQYDIQPAQISIEAKIVEITGKDVNTLGTDWKYTIQQKDTTNSAGLEMGASGATLMNELVDGGSIKFGIINGDSFDLTLKALLNNTNSNLLSSPNITTISGKTAIINVGDKIPYPVAAEEGKPVTYAFEDVGIKLEVTPIITDGNIISMAVKPKVSNQNGSTPDNRPIVATRDADTNVIVKDGETVVIGGLIREDEVNTVNSVPILGDIPFIGELFKSRATNKTKTNLIFFITPKIISGTNLDKNK